MELKECSWICNVVIMDSLGAAVVFDWYTYLRIWSIVESLLESSDFEYSMFLTNFLRVS